MKKLNANLKKPKFGDSCNGCGYCCTAQPCMLAQEFLRCEKGPCVALENRDGRFTCGLVRNPLGYLFKAVHPKTELHEPPSKEGYQLSEDLATALGIGLGCDADDDEDSNSWPIFLIKNSNENPRPLLRQPDDVV